MAREEFAGGAPRTTLNGSINGSATSLTLAAGTGYPTGATGPFVIVIDRGTASEEKILCDSRSGDTITVNVSGRGYDDTAAQAHASGAYVEHVLSAAKLDELDAFVNTAKTGDVTSPAGSTVNTIAANAVTTGKIADDAVTYDKLVGASATARFLARSSSGAGNWEEITAAQALALLSLDSTDLSDFTEAVQDLIGAQAGFGSSGLTFTYDDGGNAVALVVNVDGSTIEISSDALRVKDAGIVAAKLATDAVETAKIKDANVTTAKIADDAVTADKLANSLPRGMLAAPVARTTDAGPDAFASVTDISGLSITVTPGTNRYIRIRFYFRSLVGTNAADVLTVKIREGATVLQEGHFPINTASIGQNGGQVEVVLTAPTAVAHTYKVSAQRTAGAGTFTLEGAATYPMQLTVEDIGGT